MDSIPLFHPLTQKVWDTIRPKSALPANKRYITRLDDYLSFYHPERVEDEDVGGLAALWSRVHWVGECSECGMNVWTEDVEVLRRVIHDPCPRCQGVMIPF